jgi:hypothetical protein
VSFKTRRAKRHKRRNQRKRRASEAHITRLIRKRAASIERVERGERVGWRVRWRDDKGKARARTVRRKREATAIAEAVTRGGTHD